MFEAYKTFPLGQVPGAGSYANPHSLGYVYVVGFEEPGIVKIGSAANPSTRLLELQCGCPFELQVKAAVSIHDGDPILVEFAAHRLAKDAHIRGEWFELSVDEAIAVIIKAARNKKAKFTSAQEAFEVVEKANEHERTKGFEEKEAARRAELRRKLGMEEDA